MADYKDTAVNFDDDSVSDIQTDSIQWVPYKWHHLSFVSFAFLHSFCMVAVLWNGAVVAELPGSHWAAYADHLIAVSLSLRDNLHVTDTD